MNFIFIFISSSDPNLLRKKSVKQKIKKTLALDCPSGFGDVRGWMYGSVNTHLISGPSTKHTKLG